MAEPIHELARRATRRQAPGAALAAIGELRRRLADLERAQVVNALEAGWSWSVIGQHLGISKQAAHQKHRAAVAESVQPDAGARLVIAGEARTAVRLAADEATRLGSSQVGPAHILFGVLELGSSAITNELEAAGLSVASVRSQLERLYGGAKRRQRSLIGDAEPALVDSGSAQSGPVPLAARGRAVLEGSLREAVRLESKRLDADHLLLALLRTSYGSAAELMSDLDLPREMLAARLEAALRRG